MLDNRGGALNNHCMIHSSPIDDARELLAGYGDAAWLLSGSTSDAADAGPVIYLCDVTSGRVLLLITAPGALQQLADRVDLDEQDYHDIRAALSVLVTDMLESSEGIHAQTRRGVILGAAFCVCKTRGFHITRHHGSDVQYLLVRYRDTLTGHHIFTPMPVFKSHPLPTADLESSVTHVLASEQVSHPERFPVGRATLFTQARRSVVARGA
jgi:hypothetical protein